MSKGTINITESVFEPSGNVDTEAGIIHGVKVSSSQSPSNNRRYQKGVASSACQLYEGAWVNVNHVTRPGQKRLVEDRVGKLVNPTVIDGETFAELHYMKKHPFADRLVEAAQRMPDVFGLSHDVDAEWRMQKGVQVVSKITNVRGVDIVPNPATTKSLYESEGDAMTTQPQPGPVLDISRNEKLTATQKQARLTNLLEEEVMVDPLFAPESVAGGADLIAQAFESAILSVIKDDSLDLATKKKKIGELIAEEEKAKAILTGAETPAATPTPPPEEQTQESGGFEQVGTRLIESIEKLNGQIVAIARTQTPIIRPRTVSRLQEEANGKTIDTSDLSAVARQLSARG